MNMFNSFKDALDFVYPVKSKFVDFPNTDHKVTCRCCGTVCFWGKSNKWRLYENEESPTIHQCPINPLTE